jgi:hypothetical protein
MKKNKKKYMKIPILKLRWNHIWLVVLVILAFRLDANGIAHFPERILNKFSNK